MTKLTRLSGPNQSAKAFSAPASELPAPLRRHFNRSRHAMRAMHGLQRHRSGDSQARKQHWWQKLGQTFNFAGVGLFLHVVSGNEAWAIPHLSVPDISSVNWAAVREAGFVGCVFDKDNTLTLPYAGRLHPELAEALARCAEEFAGKVVLFSNSAGLKQFDPAGEEADELEHTLGIPVLRHVDKKPAGSAHDLESHFGCSADCLVMIGDRYLTDVVYGNRNGLLTIRPAPITLEGEPTAVHLARKIEDAYVGRWMRQGVQAPPHRLAPDQESLQRMVHAVGERE